MFIPRGFKYLGSVVCRFHFKLLSSIVLFKQQIKLKWSLNSAVPLLRYCLSPHWLIGLIDWLFQKARLYCAGSVLMLSDGHGHIVTIIWHYIHFYLSQWLNIACETPSSLTIKEDRCFPQELVEIKKSWKNRECWIFRLTRMTQVQINANVTQWTPC